jgi:yecA family protein
MEPGEIRAALEAAQRPSPTALRSAVAQADALVPAVVEVLEKAADGVFLLPKQDRLLFYGLHAVAGARRTEPYRPLLRLLRRPEHELDRLLGDAITETVPRIVLATFDGDPDPLIAAIEDRAVEGALRWGMFSALARLTFDRAVPLDRTLAVIDKFDREGLADDGDLAWQGWQDAIMLLGQAHLAPRVRASWAAGRTTEREIDQRDWEQRLKDACADPANSARFEESNIAPLADPVEALRWMDRSESSAPAPKSTSDEAEYQDPAGDMALDEEEIVWLGGFLDSEQAPETTMSLEELDGFLTALAAGPETILASEYMPRIWGGEGPVFDSAEQAEFALTLLTRHWNSIARRLGESYPQIPFIEIHGDGEVGRAWAHGFGLGMNLRLDSWRRLIEDKKFGALLAPIAWLIDIPSAVPEKPAALRRRRELIDNLPISIAGVHAYWNNPERRPALGEKGPRRRKIGRNERCPCGSGKKHKACCGARA